MCLPDKLQHGSSILPARVCAQTKLPELARRLDITPHEGHVIGGVKQPYKPASAPSSWCQGSWTDLEVKWRGGVSLFFRHSGGVRWTRRPNCEIQRLAGYSGITLRHGINTQLTVMASLGGERLARPGLLVRSTCLLIYCSCWRENWVRRFSFHGILGPGSTLIPLLTFSYRQESNNAVKWCYGPRGFLLPPALFAQTVSKATPAGLSWGLCRYTHTSRARAVSPAPCQCLW